MVWGKKGHTQTEELMTIHLNVNIYTLRTLEEREGNYQEENSLYIFRADYN